MSRFNTIIKNIKVNPWGHYWGFGFLVMTYFYRRHYMSSLTDSKTLFYMIWVMSPLFLRSLKVDKYTKFIGLIPLIGFILIFNVSYMNGVVQLFMVTVGLINLLQLSDLKFNDFKIIEKYIAVACVWHSIWILLNYYFNWDFYDIFRPIRRTTSANPTLTSSLKSGVEVAAGCLGNQGYTGILLAISACFFRGWGRLCLIFPVWACSIILLIGVEVPIALCVALIAMQVPYKRYWVPVSGALAVWGFQFLDWNYWSLRIAGSAKIRFIVYEYVWKVFLANLRGVGLGFSTDFLPKANYFLKGMKGAPQYNKVHNEFLEALLGWGVFSLPVFFCMGYLVIKYRKSLHYNYAIVLGALGSLFWFPMHLSSTAFLVILSFAMLLKYHRINKKQGVRT